jgi:hypothetical protein
MHPGPEAGILSVMQAVHIFQILNHYTSRQDLDPGFGVLDNSVNQRPDWFEYWPIRNYLLGETLDESAFYGFLSPKFAMKTSLSSAVVQDFVRASGPTVDVVLLSPSIHNSAYYWNVFDHGDAEHPGLKNVARQLLQRLDLPHDLDVLVSDSRNTVHSNYFIAKPRFWKAWLAINEKMYAIAEMPDDALGQALCSNTSYRGGATVQMKIFVMERMATLLLTMDTSFTPRVRDPFVAHSRMYKLPVAVVCDALKIAYATQGRGQYRDVFLLVSGLRKFLNLLIRTGARLRFRRIDSCLRALKSHWIQGRN